MQVNTNNSVQFTSKIATTKEGHEYHKTKGGKVTGTIIGGATGGGILLFSKSAAKMFKEDGDEFLTFAKASVEKRGLDPKTTAEAKAILEKYAPKAGKYCVPVGLVLGGIATAVGLGVGAIGDSIVNKIKRNRADKDISHAMLK